MKLFTTLLICVLLALCQIKPTVLASFTTATIAGAVTDPSTDPPLSEVTTQTTPVPDNVKINLNDTAINEVITFGDNVIFVISERLHTLSPDMRPVGENILADTRDGIQSCENSLRQNGTIWEYKVCCSSYLRYGMSAFAGLAQENSRSAACRPGLFFF